MGCFLIKLIISKVVERNLREKSYRIILNFKLRDEKKKYKNIPIHRTMSLFYFELNFKKKCFKFFTDKYNMNIILLILEIPNIFVPSSD